MTTLDDDENGNKDEECDADGSHPHRDHLKTIHTQYYPNPFTECKICGIEDNPTYPKQESIKISENFRASPLQNLTSWCKFSLGSPKEGREEKKGWINE